LRDGIVVKSHRIVLSLNSFLHQLIASSWVGGHKSTLLMPDHSVEDMLLTFSLPLNAVATNGASYGMDERGESEKNRSNEPSSSDSAEAKVEEIDDHEEVEHHPEKDEEVEEAEEILNETSLLFEPELKENISPGFEKMMKQVETLKKRLQPEPFPPESPFCKSRKLNGEVKNKNISCELSGNDFVGGELDSDQLGDTIQKSESDHVWGLKSESEHHLNNEETETDLKKNFSPGVIMFPVKKGKKGTMFTKDDEHEWHLFKLNGSKPKVESDYYHCKRPTCPARLIAWNGLIKKKSGEHLHDSAKDKISCMLVEEAELAKALENPKLMENENVLLNNVGLMSSELALQGRLERGKRKVLGEEGRTKKIPKYFNVGQHVNTG